MTRFDVFRRMLADLGTPVSPHMTVLDFGCGTGELVEAALAQGFDAYGCDLYADEHWRDWKNEVVPGLRGDSRLRRIGNPYRLPFADSSIDVIISDQVLEHVLNYPEMISEH